MSTDYEPTKEQVEQMRRDIHASAPEFRPVSHELARFILRRQHERERQIKQAREQARDDIEHGRFALACKLLTYAIDQLDAPKVPTLLEAAKALKTMDIRGARGEEYVLILKAEADAIKAAVEREERGA